MDRNIILKETIDFAKLINNSLDRKDMREFNVSLKVPILDISQKYRFLDLIIDVCHRKKIEVPRSIGDFLTYDEDLQKDILYTFILNCSSKNKDKSSNA